MAGNDLSYSEASSDVTRRIHASSFSIALIMAALLLAGSVPAIGQQPAATQLGGGSGGRGFSDTPPSAEARIAEVHVRCADVVDSIQLVYVLPDGRTVAGARHGGSGGREHVLRLDSDEYITGLSGRYGDSIDSLRIHTNKRISEPFGGGGGDRDYRIEVPSGNRAVGFSGRAGDFLDAVGLTYAAVSVPRRWGILSPSAPRGSQSSRPGNAGAWTAGSGAQSQVSQTAVAGGGGGASFADIDIPEGARISALRVRGAERVDSIQAIYVTSDGQSAEGPRHGGSGGRENVLQLDNDEYIVAISGRCGNQIDSIRIHTNKRVSQLFGGSGGSRDFRIEVPASNQAVGFTGRAGQGLDAIGLTYSAVSSYRFSPGRSRRP